MIVQCSFMSEMSKAHKTMIGPIYLLLDLRDMVSITRMKFNILILTINKRWEPLNNSTMNV